MPTIQSPDSFKHTPQSRWEHGGDRIQGFLQAHQCPVCHTPALWGLPRIATMTPGSTTVQRSVVRDPPQLPSGAWGCCQTPPEPGWSCGHPRAEHCKAEGAQGTGRQQQWGLAGTLCSTLSGASDQDLQQTASGTSSLDTYSVKTTAQNGFLQAWTKRDIPCSDTPSAHPVPIPCSQAPTPGYFQAGQEPRATASLLWGCQKRL